MTPNASRCYRRRARSGRRLIAGGRAARAGRPSPPGSRHPSPMRPTATRGTLQQVGGRDEKFDPIGRPPRTLGVGARSRLRRVPPTGDPPPAVRPGAGSEPRPSPEARRRLLMGRLAGVLFLTSAGLLLIALPLSPAKASIPGTVAVAASGIAVGAFAMFAPWDRWPRGTTLVLVVPAFTLIALGNLYGSRSYTYGVFFLVAFVWIGLAHGPWTSLAVAPFAIVAYLVPFYYLDGNVAVGVSSVAV